MTLTPDDKDWTWVLERACPECGFDPASIHFREIPDTTRELVALWVELMLSPGSVSERPDATTWSPLEYAVHIRDVLRIMLARLNLMLVLEDPEFLNWDQDETAVLADYGHADRSQTALELKAAGSAMAGAIELVPDAALGRTGRRSNGSRFTVESLSAYFLHDLVHHTHDVGLA